MAVSVTAFQQRILEIPEEINLALLGGRGGGKSTGMALLSLRYGEQYRENARMLFLRRSYSGLRDFEQCTRELFLDAYAETARYSMNDHIWRLPTGAYFELAQLESAADLQKFQGRSMGLIFIDEIGQYPDPILTDMVRANLRARKGIPVRTVIAANPGSVGQTWLYRKYVAGREPWKPFKTEHGEWWVYCPSTLDDNPNLDQEKYRSQMTALYQHDPELAKAMIEGSFTSQTGAYFGSCFDPRRSCVPPFKSMPTYEGKPWDHYLAHDFGSSAPSATYLMAVSPGASIDGVYYPRDSIVLIDEYVTARKDSPNTGNGWTASILAEALVEWCAHWGVKPRGVADDAIFSRSGHDSGSIADEFARKGVRFDPAKKHDRISGWQKMRRMLTDAGKPDVPGLYISNSCTYLLETLPFLPRDQKRPEDLDSSSADHGCDAVRYGLLRQKNTVTATPFRV